MFFRREDGQTFPVIRFQPVPDFFGRDDGQREVVYRDEDGMRTWALVTDEATQIIQEE